MSKNTKKITILTSIGYGLTDIMGGGAFTIIAAWLLYYYTTFVGLTPVQGASIIAIARIVDAVVSLSIGGITDNFYKFKLGRKFGRRRFFLLIGSPLMATYILLWITGMNYWYYLFSYLLFEIVMASVLIPWETLPSEMTKDYNDRTKLSTARMFMSGTGVFLATFVPGRLIAYFGEDNAYAYFINGVFFAVLFAICIFISYKVTWEKELTPEEERELIAKSRKHKSFKETLITIVDVLKEYVSTLKIKTFRKHLGIYLLSFTAKDVFNAVFVYFCVFALNISSSLAGDLLSLSIIGVPITLVAGLLMIKIGPSNLYKISYSLMLICLGAYYTIYLTKPDSMVVMLFVISAIYQIGRAILDFTPWNVFPFIPDIDEIVTKQRREGLFAAVMTFTRKTSVALSTFCVGLILQWGGFVAGEKTQTPEAVHTIVYILVFASALLLIGALLIVFTFKLNKENHKILINEIERLKNNGSKLTVDPKTKEVVEILTGVKYEDVWKDNNEKITTATS
ncbi:MFS transporter [Parageobacillus thermoglucosidasius]|uniref:Major facilitator superfamily MFS_1 n=1 Tax=Geobacillus sp. (strain Y4.1MC1) TaxID=581103 RepID=A0A7U3YFK5_GEOS0|nr:MFS transporter [Parageobacillus thermoglucosidasius]RDE26981.1 MFS transporter [Parageobacillus thermoglucosidasius]